MVGPVPPTLLQVVGFTERIEYVLAPLDVIVFATNDVFQNLNRRRIADGVGFSVVELIDFHQVRNQHVENTGQFLDGQGGALGFRYGLN